MCTNEGEFALRSSSGKDFALLDISSANVLEAAQSLGPLRFQAIIQSDLKEMAQATVSSKSRGNIVDISINIYGPSGIAQDTGALLTQEGQFLQHPDAIDPGYKYMNPQYFETSETMELNHLIRSRQLGKVLKETVLPEVGKIMDSLDLVDSDWDIPVTSAILTPLLR